jgi:hypothetical protein
MFGLIGRLFGAPEAVTAIVDNVSAGLDKLVYTEEEKAEDRAKAVTEARAMVVQWMAATQGQNLARRLIALSITGVWLLMYLLSVLADMAAIWWVGKAEQLGQTGRVAFEAASEMSAAVMLILAFYFAAPHMGSIATAVVGRMTGKVETTDRTG